jgi:hypothetical protein
LDEKLDVINSKNIRVDKTSIKKIIEKKVLAQNKKIIQYKKL